jgi:hypothetical protein
MQSLPIITKVLSSNPAHVEVYLIQHYVIKLFSDLRKAGSFLCAHLNMGSITGQTQDFKISIGCFSTKQTTIGSMTGSWLVGKLNCH